MTQPIFTFFTVTMIVLLQMGCGLHSFKENTSCPPFTSTRSQFIPTIKRANVGTDFDFTGVPEFETVQNSNVDAALVGQAIAIEFNEVLCAAARNSELADLVDAQRYALRCRNDGQSQKLDALLNGVALEHRNSAAAAAGKLFLGLVEVELQQDLLIESRLHLDELAETIRIAAAEEFATAAGENELNAGRNRLQMAESKLVSASKELTIQLNALIQLDSNNEPELRPVYQLKPKFINLDRPAEVEIAVSNPPSIQSLQSAIDTDVDPVSILRVLGLPDALEQAAEPMSLKRAVVRWRLQKRISLLESELASSAQSSASHRREQLSRLLEAKQNKARTAARLALVKIQSSAETLALINSKINQLKIVADQLSEKQKIDSAGTYLEIHENWANLQKEKSDLITAAIEYDTAVLELLESQGRLAEQCGFTVTTGTQTSNNDDLKLLHDAQPDNCFSNHRNGRGRLVAGRLLRKSVCDVDSK